MNDLKRIDPPVETWQDKIDQAVSRGIDFYTGGFGSFVLDLIVPSDLDNRKAEFYQDVADALNELRAQRRIDHDKLESHDQFISNYTQAVLAAVQTHEREKRFALRNAVLNTALGNTPDGTRQQIFMRWIGELTPLHLRALEFLSHPLPFKGTLENAIAEAFPDSKPVNIATVIVKDLAARNLIQPDQPGTVTLTGRSEPRATTLGSAFLSFIRDPLTDSDAQAAP